jgi:hypothetical protein
VSRDFRPSVFHKTIPPRALIHGLKPFCIWLRFRRENRDNRLQSSDEILWQKFIYVFSVFSQWDREIRFWRFPNRFSRRIRSHMQNGFRRWIRTLGGIVWWKKTEGRKSRDTVPLRTNSSHFVDAFFSLVISLFCSRSTVDNFFPSMHVRLVMNFFLKHWGFLFWQVAAPNIKLTLFFKNMEMSGKKSLGKLRTKFPGCWMFRLQKITETYEIKNF